jgi:hypothetical protein
MNLKILAPIAASAVVSLSSFGCAHHPPPHAHHVVVRARPPVEKVEVVTATPGPGYIWVKGHWRHDGSTYLWVAGHWEAPRPSATWRAGHWEEEDGGWYWVEGEWVAN